MCMWDCGIEQQENGTYLLYLGKGGGGSFQS